MEPTSILSVTATCLTVVIKTSKSLVELVDNYRSVDNEISMVIVKLDTVRATISQLESLLQEKQSVPEIVAVDLNAALGACEFVAQEIHKHVERVKIGSVSGRIRHMFNEVQYSQYQRSLDSQIAALGVLLTVLLLKSQNEQRFTLNRPDSRRLLREAKSRVSADCSPERYDDIVSLYCEEENSPSSTGSSGASVPDFLSSPSSTISGLLKSSETYSTQDAQDNFSSLNNLLPVASFQQKDLATDRTFASNQSFQRPQRRVGQNGNRAKLTEELQKAVVDGAASLADALCQQGAKVNCRLQESLEQQLVINKGLPRLQSFFGKISHVTHASSKTTLLHHAAEKGHVQIVQTLVKHGANLDARAKGAKTPLHVADDGAAELLISLGADISAQDSTGATPLHYMAAKGQVKAVEKLVQQQSSAPNMVNKQQQTPLHLACQHGHADTAAALLQMGAFADAVDEDGLRPLHYAVKYGHNATARLLLAHTVDVEAPARDCWSPIHYAASEGHVDVMSNLIKDPSTDIERPALGRLTALHMATAKSHVKVVDLLLSASANIEAETEKGERPLHLAVINGRYDMVGTMLRHGANVNAKTLDGNTILLEACRAESPPQNTIALVQLVLDNGARVNAQNCFGKTPLSVACARPHSALSVVRLLLQNGARVRSVDYIALWRNHALPAWEKRAVHAAFNEVANEGPPKEEIEWLMISV